MKRSIDRQAFIFTFLLGFITSVFYLAANFSEQISIFIIALIIVACIVLYFSLVLPELFVFLAFCFNFLKSYYIPGLSWGSYGVTPFMGFIFLALLGFGYQTVFKKNRFILPVGWLFLLGYIFFVTLSLLYARNFSEIFGAYARNVLAWIFVILFVQVLNTYKSFMIMLRVILVQAFIVVSWGIYAGIQAAGSDLNRFFFWQQYQKNEFAAYLSVVLVLALATLLVEKKPWEKILAFILIPMALVAWLFTFSRGGLLSIFVSVIFFLALELNKRVLRKLGSWVFIALIIALIGFVSAPSNVKTLAIDGFQSIIGLKPTLERNQVTIDYRVEILQAAGNVFIGNPVTGIGFGQWQYVSPIQTQTFDLQTNSYKFAGLGIHNRYAGIAVESGIFALLSYLAFLATSVYVAFKFRAKTNSFYRTYINAFLAALVGVHLSLQFTPAVLWEWPAIGLLLGLINLIGTESNHKPIYSNWIRIHF